MGIKNWFSNKWEEYKQRRAINKSINDAKQLAYQKAMVNGEAEAMGKAQAGLEREHRIKVYQHKLKKKREKMKQPTPSMVGGVGSPIDYNYDFLGLKNKQVPTKFDVI